MEADVPSKYKKQSLQSVIPCVLEGRNNKRSMTKMAKAKDYMKHENAVLRCRKMCRAGLAMGLELRISALSNITNKSNISKIHFPEHTAACKCWHIQQPHPLSESPNY